MPNISHKVWAFIKKDPSIEESLLKDIVNVMALAKYIIKREKLEGSTHSVISAIRRYKKEVRAESRNLITEILKDSKISTKSRIVSITMSRDFSFLAGVLPEVFKLVDVTKGDMLRMAEGRESLKIFTDTKKKEDMLKIIPKDKIFQIEESLGEINIHLDESKGDAPGILSAILHELAYNDINVVELIGCMPELIIIIKEKDISKTHDALLRFFYGSS